jgi:hypothetical protein
MRRVGDRQTRFLKKRKKFVVAGARRGAQRIAKAGEISRSAQVFSAPLKGFAGGFGHEIPQVSRPTGRPSNRVVLAHARTHNHRPLLLRTLVR